MYIIKSGALYFDGFTFVAGQKNAKRLLIDMPTSTFKAYLDILFDDGAARFVKLKPNRSNQFDSAYDDGFDDGFDYAGADDSFGFR